MSQPNGSRLIVKNLPSYLTEERLKKHFNKKGVVTDVKIVRTKGGKSRQFGFVGYKTTADAQKALAYFNDSFVDTSKISVALALAPGDESIARPWSKYSKGSSAYVKHRSIAPKFNKGDSIDDIFASGKTKDTKKRKRDEEDEFEGTNKKTAKKVKTDPKGKKGEAEEDDPQFKEYMKLMSKNPMFWANDDATVEVLQPAKGQPLKATKKQKDWSSDDEGESDSDSEEYQQVPAKVDSEEEKDSSEDSDSVADNPEISDLEYMKMRMKQIKSESSESEKAEESDESKEETSGSESQNSESFDVSSEDTDKKGRKDKKRKRDDNGKDIDREDEKNSLLYAPSVGDTGRLFVRNLSFDCTEDDLMSLFSKYGEVASVHIPIDKITGRSKCFAFILFSFPADASEALSDLDGSSYQGRLLHILPAKEPIEKKQQPGPVAASSQSQYQKEKQAKLIDSAGKNSDAWNPLFMRGDTVVNAMANKYNVDKADILDPTAKDMALRQALGETNIIAETKKFLEDEGVAVEALEGLRKKETDIQRSKNVILVKNISYATSESEIKTLFGRYGSISKVVLPPSKTLALVEFAQPSEARTAFSSLAYREHLGVPLFLEWAPTNVWNPKKEKLDKKRAEKQAEEGKKEEKPKTKAADISKSKILAQEEEELAEQEIHEAQTTLYVKNLNWDTTEKELEHHFSGRMYKLDPLRKIRRVTIAKKKDMKHEGKLLSLGFGFVEFGSRDEALDAMKQLQAKLLDGHALEISFSQKGRPTQTKLSKHKSLEDRNDVSTKLMVRNVPFQANKNELKKLFSAYGEVKTLRIPLKQGGKGHRGFAFVEYLTKEEAFNAMKMLSNSHLYGRHLVIDFEKGEKGLDEIREKTKHLFEKNKK